MFTRAEVQEIYARTAAHYDRAVRIFPLAGLRMGRYRREAIQALNLEPGDTVVELGCGTGLNLDRLQDAVGPQGRIIGVDLTPEMLREARRRVDRNGWSNVELIHADVAEYPLPHGIDAVLSTFALCLSPEYDRVIRNVAGTLAPGGRCVLLDLKRPAGWPEPLVRFAAWLNRPFAVTVDLAERHPWESLRSHLHEVLFRQYYFGALYLCAAERAPS